MQALRGSRPQEFIAPVLYDMKILEKGCARAVVVNSGNANACTGDQGYKDCEETAAYAASRLAIAPDEVFVSSTGVIGKMLDMKKIKSGIDALSSELGYDGGSAAAEAILTTDTVNGERIRNDPSEYGDDALLHNK